MITGWVNQFHFLFLLDVNNPFALSSPGRMFVILTGFN